VGLARCGTVFPVSVVVGAAVPAAVCRWGLCSCCPGVERCLSGVYESSSRPCATSWPLQDIAITNMVWCMAYRGEGRWGACIAQWTCNSIAMG